MVTHAPPFRYGRREALPTGRQIVGLASSLPRMSDDTEIELQADGWTAVVSAFGASLRGLTWGGEPVVTGYRGAAGKQGGQGDVLIPFPGRVKGGRYVWDGIEHHLPLTDKDGPNAIHGFVRQRDWQVEARTAASASFRLEFGGADGYPFPLTMRMTYEVAADGLHVACDITNTGLVDAPVGMGFHPYFTVGSAQVDTDVLELPFDAVLEFEDLIPTGRLLNVAEAGLDFRTPRAIGATRLNHCFALPIREPGSTAPTRIRLSGPERAATVWMDHAVGYVVVYSGDALPPALARASLAIEPMTCATDALNHHDWGLTRLAPGSTVQASWGVSHG